MGNSGRQKIDRGEFLTSNHFPYRATVRCPFEKKDFEQNDRCLGVLQGHDRSISAVVEPRVSAPTSDISNMTITSFPSKIVAGTKRRKGSRLWKAEIREWTSLRQKPLFPLTRPNYVVGSQGQQNTWTSNDTKTSVTFGHLQGFYITSMSRQGFRPAMRRKCINRFDSALIKLL
ncbi:hypothetical protein ACO22_04073 [Paracoccidioides brasiliensis]|uniref:Uncharacterized protein n=1 Tax=Paracoccidioides brasiliensis TaxID=121759 RepID=A0A1D2JE32_PARBR|nr:hypothetical protein ACO22_04073 [Paracoccidioides brasiliensis]ODH51435.1 hypothetical protein GX48_02493 [Paracoccidioides brasiliensis]